MNSKCTVKNPLPTSISSQHYALTLIPSKKVFKGSLHIDHSICSEKRIKEKEKFLMDIFVESGHNKQFLINLVLEPNQ